MDYILSQRGRPLIVVDGFLYRKNRGAYWRCIRCTKYKCKSRLILRPGRQPVCVEKHSHAPEKEKIEWGRKAKSANSEPTEEPVDEPTDDTEPPATAPKLLNQAKSPEYHTELILYTSE